MNLVESRVTIIITYALLGIAAFIALFPIVLMLLNSLKTTPEIALSPLGMPEVAHWNNYANAWKGANFTRTFFNLSLIHI